VDKGGGKGNVEKKGKRTREGGRGGKRESRWFREIKRRREDGKG